MTEVESRLLESLRALGGTATIGDLAQRSALASHEVEASILAALSHAGGHVAVDEHGQLIYSIERTRPLPRFEPSLAARIASALWTAFRFTFFAALSLALVFYFVIYVVLVIALLVVGLAAAAKGGDCDCDCGCDCKGCDGCGACCDGNICHGFNRGGDAIYKKTVARKDPRLAEIRDALRERQAQARTARQVVKRERAHVRATRLHNALGRFAGGRRGALDFPLEVEVVTGKPPFLRAVRDFVFGPLRAPPSTDAERDNLLGFIRDHGGRVTATDAVLLTGLARADADRLLLDLAVRHGGDVDVTDDGVIVYTFERFVVSAGSDLDTLAWLDARGDTPISVSEFARDKNIGAREALTRIELLAQLGGARIEHGATTTFLFDEAARERLRNAASEHQTLRDYHYTWERLEMAPAIIGVPAGSRGWIWGFNIFNLVLSSALLLYYWDGARVVGELFGFMSPTFELWALGWLPFLLSAGVFLIPLGRLIVEGLRNGGRKRRNLRRILLLALAHRIQRSAQVTASDLARALERDVGAEPAIDKWLTRFGVELEATLTPDGTLAFELAHRELATVIQLADALDPSRYAIQPIVYDTSKPL